MGQKLHFWILIGLLLLLTACNMAFPSAIQTAIAPAKVQNLGLQVLGKIPHDTTSFTEGLVYHNGKFYESAGEYGKSRLLEIDARTGRVLRQIDLPAEIFGEGLALEGDQLVQLSWHETTAFLYNVQSLARLGSWNYQGEGWGLCFDGMAFFRSDGSDKISIHAATSFGLLKQLSVTMDKMPVIQINELECVDDSIYANVWHTNNILKIDKASGRVTALIDASGLLTPEETRRAGSEGVLNGIAYNPQTDTFFITGKLWPWLFEVRFVPLER